MIEMHKHDPDQLTVTELIQSTRGEITQFLHKQPIGDACAWELFRRAIVHRDEQAWTGIYDLYAVMVDAWILRQDPTLASSDLAALVNEVFAKFSRSVSPGKLRDFPGLRALLVYLKRCAGSVAVDYRRAKHSRAAEEPWGSLTQEPMLDDVAEAVADQLAAQELWRIVARLAPVPENRLILAMLWQGFSPRDIQHSYPHLFPTLDAVYHAKRKVLERLRRNRQLLAFLAQRSDASGRTSPGRYAAEGVQG
jgi:DNA-directed RNA polymerase specialized sigma24 family protein